MSAGKRDSDIFGQFCSHSVKVVSGPFNKRFWQVDVPRAALAYPALWHASVALAAIHLSTKQGSARPNSTVSTSSQSVPRNYHYVVALEHFNKSIRHVAQALQGHQGRSVAYVDQEMAIMTNIVYIGIAAMLDDTQQLWSHWKNLVLLLESVRFGEGNPAARRGILEYEDLLSIVLSLDGNHPFLEDFPYRWRRSWVVKLPQYSSYASTTQAYIGMLGSWYRYLQPRELMSVSNTSNGSNYAYRLSVLNRVERQHADFARSPGATAASPEDYHSLQYIHQVVRMLKVDIRFKTRTRRADAMRDEQEFASIVEYVAAALAKSPVSAEPYSQSTPPFQFSPSFGSLIENVNGRAHSVPIRRRALEVMRKWPFQEGGNRSSESVAFEELVIAHELSGPERTRARQLNGHPTLSKYPDDYTDRAPFDGTRECECILEGGGAFICRDHKLSTYRFVNATSPEGAPLIELISSYEERAGMPWTRHPLIY